MILLDPDLEPVPAPKATSAKRPVASGPTATPRNQRIPSARTLARFLTLAQKTVRLKGQVTVLLTTDAAIRQLNRQFRGINKATDVLSFPAEGIGAEEMAGDLAISVPTALRQAVEQGHSLSTEIRVLILHGLLHLSGHDHEADEGQMACREGRLRERLGLPQGLIERAEAPRPSACKPATKTPSKTPEAPALKGHGFSRAVKSPKKSPALAAEGMQIAEKTIHRGLKPKMLVAGRAARLKPRPFKAPKKVSPTAGGR
jgi:probable rRNA maturation factor